MKNKQCAAGFAYAQNQEEPIRAAVASVHDAPADATAVTAEFVPMSEEDCVRAVYDEPVMLHVAILANSSATMRGLEGRTVNQVNEVLGRCRTLAGDSFVSVIFFAEKLFVAVDRVPVAEVAPLRQEDYKPYGCGMLMDALGATLSYIEESKACIEERVRIIAVTNDSEPASCVLSYNEVLEMLREKCDEGWEFSLVVVS